MSVIKQPFFLELCFEFLKLLLKAAHSGLLNQRHNHLIASVRGIDLDIATKDNLLTITQFHIEALRGVPPDNAWKLGVIIFHCKIVVAISALIHIADLPLDQNVPEIRFQQLFDLVGDITNGGYIKRKWNLIRHVL
jgi:hypothetical protein